MATPTLLDVINCSAAGALGTGIAGCRTNRKRVTTLYLFPSDFIFDTAVIDKDYMQTQQTLGKLIVLEGVVDFVDSTPEDSYATRNGSGDKTLLTQFPYEYTASFDNGYKFQAALDSLSGKGNYSVAVGDVDDVIWMTRDLQGNVKPFSLSVHQAGKYLGEDGTNQASETFFLQLSNRKEVDRRMAMYKPTDFGSTDLKGVNDVTITVNPITAPSTSLVFKPLLNDGTHMAEGLVAGDFIFKKNGSPITPTGAVYNTTAKTVTTTLAAASTAADVYSVEIDGIVLVAGSGILYKTEAAGTVIAG